MEIETGIPIPEASGGSALNEARATLAKMKPGQSVLVDGKAHQPKASAFRQAAREMQIKVVTRTQPFTDGKRKTRIWRTA
jgi:hypothetical protein